MSDASNSPKKTFNRQAFEIFMFVYNNDISLSAPDLINNEGAVDVPPGNITSMEFENSIDNMIPTATFQIQDNGHKITNRLKMQNCRLFISVKTAGGDEVIYYNLTYLVKNFNIISTSIEFTQYIIYCELDNAIPLNTLCEYATSCDLNNDNEQPENPYKIARNILTQVGYKLYPLTMKDEKGQDIPTKYDLPYTNDFYHFITHTNMKCIDALHYLFSIAVGENGMNPPAYLIHNLKDDKGYITTLENCFSPQAIKTQPKPLLIPFSITKSVFPSRQYTMDQISLDAKDGGIENAQQFFNYKFSEYDQEERLWESYDINKIVLNDLLTRGINDSEEVSLYVKTLNEDISLAKYYKYVPHDHPRLYDVMRNLELYSSNMQFVIDGDLRFDIGQVILVYEKGSNESKLEQFNGRWLVCKVKHTFRNGAYKTSLVCCRRFYQKHSTFNDKK